MLLIRLLRFLRGYVCFCATDGFPERFLNLCTQKGVPVWDVCVRGSEMTGRTSIEGYKAMRDCAKRSGSCLRIREKHGLPFFLHRYRRRVGLLIGLALFLAALTALSGMVWSIEVTGNEQVPAETILAQFEAQGLRLGIPRRRIDTRQMGETALKQLPELSWLSLNLQGSSAVIEVREIFAQKEPQDENPPPQNIIAARDGQLAVLEVYQGKPQAKAEQAVRQGGLLASGVIENSDGSTRLTHAEAYAVARTPFSLGAAPPRQYNAQQVSLWKSRYTICFLWFRIPLGPTPKPEGSALRLQSRNTFYAGKKPLPAILERQSYLVLTQQERSLTDTQWKLVTAQQLFEAGYQDLRGAQVIVQESALKLNASGAAAVWQGAAYRNIGQAVAITAEE